MSESIDQRIRDMGIRLPGPLKVPAGVELPFGNPVEVEAELELR